MFWESDTPQNVGTTTTIEKPQSYIDYFSSFFSKSKTDPVKSSETVKSSGTVKSSDTDTPKTGSDMVGGKRKSIKSRKTKKSKTRRSKK